MGTYILGDGSMQQASAKDYWCRVSALFKHSVINFVQEFFSLYLDLFGGHQLTLRNFRGAPV